MRLLALLLLLACCAETQAPAPTDEHEAPATAPVCPPLVTVSNRDLMSDATIRSVKAANAAIRACQKGTP